MTNIVPSLAGVISCVSNAQRLYDDSKKVSKPTSASLVELALEEVAKGFWILFMYILQPDMRGSFVEKMFEVGSLTREKFESLKTMLSENPDYMVCVTEIASIISEPMELTSFASHKQKLQFLRLVKRMIEIQFPYVYDLVSASDLERVLKATTGKFNTWKPKKDKKEEMKEIALSTITSLDDRYFDTLDAIKQDGFYVSYSNGEYKGPDVKIYATGKLEEFLEGMLFALRLFTAIL